MDPASIPRWRSKLPNPLHPSYVYRPDRTKFGSSVDYYEIGMRQIKSQILPAGCPSTTVFAYGVASDPLDNPSSFAFPGRSFVAVKGRTVKVKYVHDQLPTTHFLPIDRSFACGSAKNCSPDVRTVVHLHGAYVDEHSDGFPEAWKSPEGLTGTMYNEIYEYTNNQEATLLWYHDHAMGITRLNVYAGLAGFYFLRIPREATLQALNLLPRYPYDIPIVIQDRTFKPDGSLYYPDTEFKMPYMMNYNFGSVLIANGKAYPRALMEPRKYRIRLLNGCNSRFLSMKFVSRTGSTVLPVWQVITDSGLLNSPVDKTNKIISFSPAERGEFVVDFSVAQPNEEFILTNAGPTPAPYGEVPAAGGPLGEIVLFRVKKPFDNRIPDALPPPAALRTNPRYAPTDLTPYSVRKVALYDVFDATKFRFIRLLGTSTSGGLHFMAPVTENVPLGATEIWEIYNPTGETHPVHIHQVKYLVVDRRNIARDSNNQMIVGQTSYDVLDEEKGPKDTVQALPGTVTRLFMTFNLPGIYVWHCHLLEHEDYDMMRPICVGGNCSTAWMGEH